jgi:NTP pyrophosphohydrolases including oxidative damage repair enzymes
MIRQYRHGTGRVSVEFPGGIIDKGEDPVLAIARELLEETGYRAEMILPLGDLSPNPAFMTNTFHAFIAEGCYLEGDQALDENEEIEILLVPEREAIDMIGAEDYGPCPHDRLALFLHALPGLFRLSFFHQGRYFASVTVFDIFYIQ